MYENINEVPNESGLSTPRMYCLRLIEFISSLATDPHLYFQHKLTADISAAQNLTDLMVLLNQLIDWVDAADFQSIQLMKLDEILTADELPSFSLMRSSVKGELRRILATGRIATEPEYGMIRDSVLKTQKISSKDRIFVDRLLKAYESRE